MKNAMMEFLEKIISYLILQTTRHDISSVFTRHLRHFCNK
jgi:hypothetical protein